MATQPCPCGWLGHPRRGCRCTPTQLAQMSARVSGPVLDRIDLQVEVPALTAAELNEARPGETSDAVRARGAPSAALPTAALRRACALDAVARALIATAVDRVGLSERGVHRALRVARTLTDLAGREAVAADDVAEALQYRAYETRRLTVP